jgi:cell division protein FtsL
MKLGEWVWKVFTVVLGAVILPLAGWVWSMNVHVAGLQNDLGDAEKSISVLEKKVDEAEELAHTLISVEKDIEYMRAALDRIEELVTK